MSWTGARWVAILLFLVSFGADAAFFYSHRGQIANLAAQVTYRIEDPKSPQSFEQVSRESQGWISQKDKRYVGTTEPASIWIRFDVPAEIKLQHVWLNVPIWEYEEFFVLRDGVLVDRPKAGTALTWDERVPRVTMMPPAAAGFVPVELHPETRTTIYGHLRTENRAGTVYALLVRVWDPQGVLDGERRDRLQQGVFYGIMFFLIAYNLGLFLAVREVSFLYYVLMEAGFAVTWAFFTGLAFEFLTPNHPFVEFKVFWVCGLIGGFGAWQFVRHYLDTARNVPRVDLVLKVVAYGQFIAAPLAFLPIQSEVLMQWMFIVTPVGATTMIIAVAIALKRKHPLALNLLVALTCIGVGVSIVTSTASGWLPQNDWTLHAGQIGSALAGIVLSIGLGYRLQGERTRLARLKRFLSPKVSELIAAGQLDDPLATRRREVTIVFVDLRGFTAFSETAAPEDVLGVLREYHAEIGRLVGKHEGTIEHFAGDGVMIIFNDPAPLPDPALAAVTFAVELRDKVASLSASWRKLGHQLACGLGIAQGYATIGTIGFPGRQDYGVIGAVNNLAARLCAQAAPGQILVSQRVFGRVEERVVAEPVGELSLKGIHAPVPAFSIVALKPPAPASPAGSEALAAT